MATEAAKVAQKCVEAKSSNCLDLSHCDLRKFPDVFYFLMKGIPLQTITLAHNDLKVIPAKFGIKFSTLTSMPAINHTNTLLVCTL